MNIQLIIYYNRDFNLDGDDYVFDYDQYEEYVREELNHGSEHKYDIIFRDDHTLRIHAEGDLDEFELDLIETEIKIEMECMDISIDRLYRRVE